ncbi:MAG: hypothetical protein V7K41_28885 [Nostoc sp.]|uniref:hypothetical protein n=1 Tax=Nostoc sp. TaxID=1180 RepID=UPI002FF60989
MRHVFLNSLFVLSSILGITFRASAEQLVTAAIDTDNEIIYQVDLDNRSEYQTDSGWRHVIFYLSTKGDARKHPSIAACSPYDIKSEYYGFNWESNGGGFPKGTIAGNIARVACDL